MKTKNYPIQTVDFLAMLSGKERIHSKLIFIDMNIFLPCLVFFLLSAIASSAEKSPTWTVLFNGKDLSNFRCYGQNKPSKSWKIENGIIKFKKVNGATGGDLMTRDKFDFFDLELDWKLPVPGNSGIIFRVAEIDGPAYKTGLEMQIFHQMKAGVKTDTGSCYALYSPQVATMKPIGHWNRAKLTIKPGNQVSHFLNGKLLCSYEIGGEDWKKRVKDSKFRNWEQFGEISNGHICLQDHGSEVWFRNIRIRKL